MYIRMIFSASIPIAKWCSHAQDVVSFFHFVCQEMGLDGSDDASGDKSEEESEEDLPPRRKQHGLAWDPVREAAAGGR